MFLPEWSEFHSVACLARKKTWWQLAFRCWNRARPWNASDLVSFLVPPYLHPPYYKIAGKSEHHQWISLQRCSVQIVTWLTNYREMSFISSDTTSAVILNQQWHYISSDTTSTATLHQQWHYINSDTTSTATLHQQRHYTSSDTTSAVTLHQQ